MNTIIVVGAGASGLMAAITAGRAGAEVTVLERLEKPGKKLLMTGNGRCNLTNTVLQDTQVFRGEEPEFAAGILEQFGTEDTLDFFHSLGVLTKERSGYVYPYTGQASTVLEALLLEAKRLGIRIKCSEEVLRIQKAEDDTFEVETATWTYHADRVILSPGTKAACASGFHDSGYLLARSLGHRGINPMPALVPLKTEKAFPEQVSGVRCHARVGLLLDGKPWVADRGELQWTAYGISGIVVFQVSRFAVRALSEGRRVEVTIDLLADYTEEELLEMAKSIPPEFLLNGLFAKKIQTALLRKCFGKKKPVWSEASILKLLKTARDLRLRVLDSKGFENAQICCGGILTSQVSGVTLESVHQKGLYLTGEVLDIDGMCGGYNLQWAWSTGYVAGYHAAAARLRKR